MSERTKRDFSARVRHTALELLTNAFARESSTNKFLSSHNPTYGQ